MSKYLSEIGRIIAHYDVVCLKGHPLCENKLWGEDDKSGTFVFEEIAKISLNVTCDGKIVGNWMVNSAEVKRNTYYLPCLVIAIARLIILWIVFQNFDFVNPVLLVPSFVALLPTGSAHCQNISSAFKRSSIQVSSELLFYWDSKVLFGRVACFLHGSNEACVTLGGESEDY